MRVSRDASRARARANVRRGDAESRRSAAMGATSIIVRAARAPGELNREVVDGWNNNDRAPPTFLATASRNDATVDSE